MKKNLSRRKALASVGAVAAVPASLAETPNRIPPRQDLVNVLEFESVARQKLPEAVFATIAGGDRSYFNRMTFRPRLMVPTMKLDLTSDLFGQKMFAPILVGPAARQQTFHPDGELAMVRGAGAAKATVVVSSDSSYPLEKIAAEAKAGLWYQVYPDADTSALRTRVQEAVKAGCKAVCLTVASPYRGASASGAPIPSRLASLSHPAVNWSVIDQLRQGISVPFVLKGILTPEEADAAVKHGVQGIVVSNYGGLLTPGLACPMEMLASITAAVAGKIPVLIDGGFRRGSDAMKALAFGAQAVLVSRPALWGLAAYGAEGVQSVLEMLQTELARTMCQCGTETLKAVGPSAVKIHEA
jgi:4-hydroxymandelate oxidase